MHLFPTPTECPVMQVPYLGCRQACSPGASAPQSVPYPMQHRDIIPVTDRRYRVRLPSLAGVDCHTARKGDLSRPEIAFPFLWGDLSPTIPVCQFPLNAERRSGILVGDSLSAIPLRKLFTVMIRLNSPTIVQDHHTFFRPKTMRSTLLSKLQPFSLERAAYPPY